MSAVRCIDCGRAVHPEVGGAWCREHRPVDLTGGTMPYDRVFGCTTKRGDASRVRLRHGEGLARLRAAGWVFVERRGAKKYWRAPTGVVREQRHAVYTLVLAETRASAAGVV